MLIIIFKTLLFIIILALLFIYGVFALAKHFNIEETSLDSKVNKIDFTKNPKYRFALDRIKYDTNTHECICCKQVFEYRLRDLYQEFGSCGGYESELFVDCNSCGCKNATFKSL